MGVLCCYFRPKMFSLSDYVRYQKVASHMFSLLASVESTTVYLEIPVQSPPPSPGDRHLATVSPPPPSRETVAR